MEIENITEKEIIRKKNENILKANEYMRLILYGVDSLERQGKRPVIVMSMDIMSLLSAFTKNTISYHQYPKITTCFGYDVKIAVGSNILLVAYDLQPMWKGE